MAKFTKGQSGNPGGRAKLPVEVREAAKRHTVLAVAVLAHTARRGKQEGARVRAAEVLLNRAWGTPESTATVKVARNEVSDLSRLEILRLLAAQGVIPAGDDDQRAAVH